MKSKFRLCLSQARQITVGPADAVPRVGPQSTLPDWLRPTTMAKKGGQSTDKKGTGKGKKDSAGDADDKGKVLAGCRSFVILRD